MSVKPTPLEAAASLLHVREIPGKRHDSRIVSWLRAVGIKRGGDERAWCAAFLAHVHELAGIEHPGRANARSWMRWGRGIQIPWARPGDVVVLWRSSPSSWKGHGGLYLRHTKTRVLLLGGNQGNRVSAKWYPRSRVLSIRRAWTRA